MLSWGTLELVLQSPSAALYWSSLGTSSLGGKTASAFHTLTFNVPQATREALNAGSNDLRIVVILNVEHNAGDILLDRLRALGVPTDDPPAEDTPNELLVQLPFGFDVDEVFLGAGNALTLDDRVTLGATGEIQQVAGLGGVEVGAGVQAHATLRSGGGIAFLRSQSHVFGDAIASGQVTQQDNVVVDGTIRPYAGVTSSTTRWAVTWPVGSAQDLNQEPDTSGALAPDLYGDVKVKSRATLVLQAGSYYLDSLSIEPEAHVQLNTASGPVRLYIKDQFRSQAAFEIETNNPSDVLLAYFGTEPARFEAAALATVIAPSSIIELRRPANGAAHRGAFFGDSIHVFSDATVLYEPFDFSSLCSETPALCQGNRPGASARSFNGTFYFPQGVAPKDVVVAARRELSISGAAVDGEEGQLVTVAQGPAHLGSVSSSVSVVASGQVTMDAGATIEGDLRSEVAANIDPAAEVAGDLIENATLSPPEIYTFQYLFGKPNDGELLLQSGRERILSGGHYSSVHVESNAVLYLRAGKYQMGALTVATGGQVVVDTDHGWVTIEVADQLSLLGEVSGLGGAEERLLITYVGSADANVSGSFKGTLLAPQSELAINGGEHAALFYADRVVVTGNAQVGAATSSFGGQLGLTPSGDYDKKSDERGTTLEAAASAPASGDLDSDEVVVPHVLPVAAGNAGNGRAVLTLMTPSGTVDCEYRGGAASLHPTTLDERAKGREYTFVECSDGTPAGGTIVGVTQADLSLEGDNQDVVPDTRVHLSLGDSCRGDLPQPVSPAQSRALINGFSWDNAQPVPETTQDGRPALYYAYLYIKDQEDLDTAQRMLIHTQTMPLFPEEMQEYVGHCGTIGMEGDGEGTFTFAVLPGATYNAILALRSKTDVAEDQREPFRAIILRQPPAGTVTEHGELDLTELTAAGFRYLGLRELPTDEALREEIFGMKPLSQLIDAVEWVFEASKTAVRRTLEVAGFVDLIFGTHDLTIDVDVPLVDYPHQNSANRFASTDKIRRAWGVPLGGEVSVANAEVTLTTIVQRATSLGLPYLTAVTSAASPEGKAIIRAPNDNAISDISVFSLCVRLASPSVRITSQVLVDSHCDFKLKKDELNDLRNEIYEAKLSYNSPSLLQFAELADAAEYYRLMTGGAPKPVNVLRGAMAYLLSPAGRAWTSCLGFNNLAAEVLLDINGLTNALGPLVGLGSTVDPATGFTAEVLLRVLSDHDIYMPNTWSNHTFGVSTHEYGHFALCDLSNKLEANVFATATKTFDTVLFTGKLDGEDESRTINEAFADFFVYQVTGGVNYVQFFENSENGYLSFNYASPGLDGNATRANWEIAYASLNPAYHDFFTVNWVSSILQDLYDGHPKNSLAPTKGESWAADPSTGLLIIDPLDRTNTEREQVKLPGEDIKNFAQFFFDHTDGGGGYRYEAFEEGVVATMKNADVSWCEQCLLLVDNYVATPDSTAVKARMEACTQGRLAELLGEPPLPLDRLDAFSCKECSAGTAMAHDGTCDACGPDLIVDWGASGFACDDQTSFSNTSPLPGDRCPDEFLVQINNVNPTPRADLSVVEIGTAQQALPEGATCAEQSASISVGASTSLAGPYTEIGPGVRAATDCGAPPGLACSGDCGWPLSESVLTPSLMGTSGGHIQLRIDTSNAPGTITVVNLEAEQCIIH